MADKVKFQTNIWESPIALKYAEGKEVESQFDPSGKQIMYSLADGRIMFLSPRDAETLDSLFLRAGEPFEAARVETQEGRRKFVKFEARKIGEPGGNLPDRNQAPAVTRPQQVAGNVYSDHSTTAARSNGNGNGNGHANGNGHTAAPPPSEPRSYAEIMTACLIDAVESTHQAEAYAAQKSYSVRFTSEDIQGIASTIFIQISRGSIR